MEIWKDFFFVEKRYISAWICHRKLVFLLLSFFFDNEFLFNKREILYNPVICLNVICIWRNRYICRGMEKWDWTNNGFSFVYFSLETNKRSRTNVVTFMQFFYSNCLCISTKNMLGLSDISQRRPTIMCMVELCAVFFSIPIRYGTTTTKKYERQKTGITKENRSLLCERKWNKDQACVCMSYSKVSYQFLCK